MQKNNSKHLKYPKTGALPGELVNFTVPFSRGGIYKTVHYFLRGLRIDKSVIC